MVPASIKETFWLPGTGEDRIPMMRRVDGADGFCDRSCVRPYIAQGENSKQLKASITVARDLHHLCWAQTC